LKVAQASFEGQGSTPINSRYSQPSAGILKRQDSGPVNNSFRQGGYGGNTNQSRLQGGEIGCNFLLPNEIRISQAGNFGGQAGFILHTMESGYKNCKVVARGQAVERLKELLGFLQKRAP
jgi:hypothetical protein